VDGLRGPPLRPRRRAVALTTRNRAKAQRLARAYDALERRITELSEQEELARIRPELDGNEIMRLLGVPPGPLVGQAYDFLLELRLEQGELGRDRVTQELLRWAAAAGIVPPDPGPDPGPEPDGDWPRPAASQYPAAATANPAATTPMMTGEWPLAGMKAALSAAPMTYVTLNIMS
jgi:hypothetical protein